MLTFKSMTCMKNEAKSLLGTLLGTKPTTTFHSKKEMKPARKSPHKKQGNKVLCPKYYGYRNYV